MTQDDAIQMMMDTEGSELKVLKVENTYQLSSKDELSYRINAEKKRDDDDFDDDDDFIDDEDNFEDDEEKDNPFEREPDEEELIDDLPLDDDLTDDDDEDIPYN